MAAFGYALPKSVEVAKISVEEHLVSARMLGYVVDPNFGATSVGNDL